jgi:hypothetical protein
MQEQQSAIELQQNEIKELRNEITLSKSELSPGQLQKGASVTARENKLEQNNPNPFSEKTTINYAVSTEAASALIIIRSLGGVDVKRITLEKSNSGSIEGNQFVAGTYTYTLEVNGKSLDTKLMVITK